MVSDRRKGLLKLHGLWPRYVNLKETAGMTFASTILRGIYEKQKDWLERADVICSFGATNENVGALVTFAARRTIPKVEYFSIITKTRKTPLLWHFRALQMALRQWGDRVMSNRRVLFVTEKDEIQALLRTEIIRDGISLVSKINRVQSSKPPDAINIKTIING